MESKKTQLQIGENIAVLFIFFVLLAFGFIFYSTIQKTTFAAQKEENINLKSIQTTQAIAFLPELQCSSKNVRTDNCFDMIKIESLNALITSDAIARDRHYFDQFSYSNITIREVYPGNSSWVIYSKAIENSTKISTMVPVSLYNATSAERKYSFGVLLVEVYSK